jgi:hypothetical protein
MRRVLVLCLAFSWGCGGGAGDGDGGLGNDADVNAPDGGDQCVNLECQQVTCPGGGTTSLTGTVTIPDGTIPLPNVIVYVPNADLPPISQDLSCERCEDQISGLPLVHTQTDHTGAFTLENMPVGEEIPLVLEIGKWRRQVTLPAIEECVDNQLSAVEAEELLRLPRNKDEGDIPRIALTTGSADALECLLRKMGMDDEEITDPTRDGRIHLYSSNGTPRFATDLHDGDDFGSALDLWADPDALRAYDIVILSCEGGDGRNNNTNVRKTSQMVTNLRDYADAGGRVFASHWHNYWLRPDGGHDDFYPVATWDLRSNPGSPLTGFVDTSFDKGQLLADWLLHIGASSDLGEIAITGARRTLRDVEAPAQRWIYNEDVSSVQNFSVNTPVDAEDEDKCGRVVFSDMHVSAGDNSGSNTRFPNGCTTTTLTPQELALVFMIFDLAACIEPDVPPID